MKVLVTGPESSGKSTLARALAWCLDGLYVAEQAREYLHARGGKYSREDLTTIWSAQLAAERVADGTGAAFVICDTGPEVITIWSKVKYTQVDPCLTRAVNDQHYDLTLLCTPDLPWLADGLREAPHLADRLELFELYRKLLPHAVVIDGSHRVGQALTRISDGIRGERAIGSILPP